MSQPVWTLSVDLQTKTATFTSGLGDAARTARERFGEVRDAAQDMGDGVAESSGRVNYSMMEARHGVMMLGEEFGIHLPRGLTTFIASLGPVGAAMEMAFPFLAIILGATLLIEHLFKIGEAAEKAAEAGRHLQDSMESSLNTTNLKMIDAEIGIRKLAGAPAWDLLAEKLRLEDAQRGIANVAQLEKSLKELLENTKVTTNWNPFNWGDGSGDVQAQAKALQAQLRGKSESDQAVTLGNALGIQSKILKEMKGQTDVSAAQLSNQQKYVDFLTQEHELLQRNADAAVVSDNLKQGTDRAEKIKAEDEAQQKEAEREQRGLDKRIHIEEEYYKKSKELTKKAAEEKAKDAEIEAHANEAFSREIIEQDQRRAKVAEEMGKSDADMVRKMAALKLQVTDQQLKQEEKLGQIHGQQLVNAEVAAQNESYKAQMQAYAIEIGALDKYGKDYEAKLKQIQDREKELTAEHEAKITQIVTTAENQRKERVIAAENQMAQAFAQTASKSIMEGKSMGQAFEQLGGQMLKTMLTNLMQIETVQGRKRFSDARTAAADAFADAGNPILGTLEGAAAFASVMAFEKGGIVPGVEKGDVVPARLTPGEAVLPKALVDGLMGAAQSGGAPGSNGDIHVHHHATYNVHALDGESVDRVLQTHSEKFANHMKSELRRMNR